MTATLIYRHPADESPPLRAFSPTASTIRVHVEHALQYAVNHALNQLYRTGPDYIPEHSEKRIDVTTSRTLSQPGSAHEEQEHPHDGNGGAMPHDQFPLDEKRVRAKERGGIPAECGPRISLTFRPISPLPHPLPRALQDMSMSSRNDSSSIFGQGATGKIRAEARPVVHGGEEAERLLAAFGAENYESDFDCLRRGVRCATLFHQHCRVGVIKFLHVVALTVQSNLN
ncbi:hypothetical protein DFH94DRAFT_695119 [Russula ochroleuca]|uniref:Uncharacterized protein n=1 Tax=Russula ochroleuca TaxID=152965 RepID=A0A9P5T692_9AGAM|nr:hypothetical protein DFH94DRAFT_695119 [Russula ochroleuca]